MENPVAKWRTWVDQANRKARSTTTFFNIRDAAYMAPGTTVYLEASNPRTWLHTKPAAEAARITYNDDVAQLFLKNSQGFDLLRKKEHWLTGSLLLRAGVLSDGSLRVMIHDLDHPYMKTFAGLKFFPYSPEMVMEAKLMKLPEPKLTKFSTFQDRSGEAYLLGKAHFSRAGQELRLNAYTFDLNDGKPESMSFLFRDRTNGTFTYGGGREIEIPLHGGKIPDDVTIDFNYAQNFACARTDFANCPLGATDKLDIEIRAGELK